MMPIASKYLMHNVYGQANEILLLGAYVQTPQINPTMLMYPAGVA